MKNFLKNTLLAASVAILGIALYSCNDLDDLEQRVDSLESRVTALETQIPALNSNIETLSNLLGSATIYSITESNGVYTITTTNGQTMTITQGAVGNTPLLSVDANGYWIVSYDDGSTYSQILVDGSPVMASTVYPQFSVDASGYWLISYDKGATFEQVLDTSGNPVTALGEGSDLFKDITYDESSGILTVILTDGYTLEIIVTPDFYCSINDVDYNTPVAFETGVARNFYVTMHGVSAAFVVVPEGWSATLGDPSDDLALLKVTPLATLTKATANSDSDLSIFATSAKGYSTIAKMSLYLSDAPVPVSPSVTLTAGEATASSLEFTVTPNFDVTSWKYMLLLSSESAPSSNSDFDDAETSTETAATTLTFTDLTEETDYVLYVLPINDDQEVYGDITFVKNTTLEKTYDTYYEMYMAGKDIVIGDRIYNLESYGIPGLITESGNFDSYSRDSGPYVYFINPGLTVNYAYTGNLNKLVLIGNDPNQKSSVANPNQQFVLGTSGDSAIELVFFNLDLDISGSGNYAVSLNNNLTGDYLAFVSCHVTTQASSLNTKFLYVGNSGKYFKNIVVSDCVINLPAYTSDCYLFAISADNTNTMDNLTIKNNVIYCGDGDVTDGRLFSFRQMTIKEVIYQNNSLINIGSGYGIVNYATVNTANIQWNLSSMDTSTKSGNFVLFRENNESAEGHPASGIVSNNIAYYSSSGGWSMFSPALSGTSGFEKYESVNTLSSSPFDGGTLDFANEIFIPNSTYSSYGAQQ